MKQLDVTILGQGYVLACPPGGEARLRAAVAQVDREMSAIRDAGKVKARERIAVLAALNLAWQMAEREAERTAETAAPRHAVASAAAMAPVAGATGAADIDIDGLLQRIDAVLGSDGQLL